MADASRVTFRLRPRREWFLPRVLELAAAGEVAGGLKKNREFYAARVDEGDLPEDMALALYDPQTSGGLLIAIPARRAGALAAALKRRRVWVTEVGEATARGEKSIVLEGRDIKKP
jgi:selenide,water dikinase